MAGEENYKLCCMCERKKGKYYGYSNECAKKGDGPASSCGSSCNEQPSNKGPVLVDVFLGSNLAAPLPWFVKDL